MRKTPQNQAKLSIQTAACSNAIMLEGKFPVVIFAPSYLASPREVFVLFEYCARNSFIILSLPCRDTDTMVSTWYVQSYAWMVLKDTGRKRYKNLVILVLIDSIFFVFITHRVLMVFLKI
tara:strand:- start:1436 stop:1795 length:360 start_codon:yes stop_codon:yes gene_type:complete